MPEASIADMRAALEAGRVTSVEIVQQYLARIATYEDLLHAALHVNRNALARGGGAAIGSARRDAFVVRFTAFRSP